MEKKVPAETDPDETKPGKPDPEKPAPEKNFDISIPFIGPPAPASPAPAPDAKPPRATPPEKKPRAEETAPPPNPPEAAPLKTAEETVKPPPEEEGPVKVKVTTEASRNPRTGKAPASGDSPAAPGKDMDEPARAAISFFNSVQKNLLDEAYSTLMKGSRIAESPDEVRLLKSKTAEAIELFGPIHGYELIESHPVGSNLLRRTYISLGRDFPLRWRFYFYRASSQWRLLDLRVDDRLNSIFEEPEDRPPAPEKTP